MEWVIVVLVAVVVITVSIVRYGKEQQLINTATDDGRGTYGERKLLACLLKAGVLAGDIYHDLYLEYEPGRYAQIDVVVLTPSGIVVFEDKDYSGWIFGDGRHEYWTQVLNYGQEKHKFYNPIKQNFTHIERLKEAFGEKCHGTRFISCIIFHRGGKLRNISNVPVGIFLGYSYQVDSLMKAVSGLRPTIYQDEESVRRILRNAVRNGRNPEVVRTHAEHVSRFVD